MYTMIQWGNEQEDLKNGGEPKKDFTRRFGWRIYKAEGVHEMLSQCMRSFRVAAKENKIYFFFDMNPLVIVLYTLVGAIVAASIDSTSPIPILKQALDGPNPDGSYNYNYETGHGIQAQEEGHLNNVGTDSEALETHGSFSYTDNDGQTYQISYIANENGFQPEGAHLPTAPPVPPQIIKALQYIAEHPEEDKEH